MDEADETPRPGKDGEGAPKTLDGEESKSEEDKMIGRGMAPSSMHPDNEYHPDLFRQLSAVKRLGMFPVVGVVYKLNSLGRSMD